MCRQILYCILCMAFLFESVYLLTQSPKKATIGDFPAVVLVFHLAEVPLCGGALIEIRHVITSALCVSRFENSKEISKLIILAGEVSDGDNYGPTRQVRQITHVILHETADLSVLRIAAPFGRSIFLEPIPMATFDTEKGTKCLLVSWSQDPSKPGDSQLFSVSAFIRNSIDCHSKSEFIYCAGVKAKLKIDLGEMGSSLICNRTLYGVCVESDYPISMKSIKFANLYNLREWVINAILWNGTGKIPKPYYRKVSQISASIRKSVQWNHLHSYVFLTSILKFIFWKS